MDIIYVGHPDDGRYVAFESWATNLVSGDTTPHNYCAYSPDEISPSNPYEAGNCQDIFWRDRQTGITRIVSQIDVGEDPGGGFNLDMSADGRYVSFETNNLFANEMFSIEPYDPNNLLNNGPDNMTIYGIYVRDMFTDTLRLGSAADGGGVGDCPPYPFDCMSWAWGGHLADDGNILLFFAQRPENMVPGQPIVDNGMVYAHNLTTLQTILIGEVPNQFHEYSIWGSRAISGNGQFAAIQTDTDLLVPDDDNYYCESLTGSDDEGDHNCPDLFITPLVFTAPLPATPVLTAPTGRVSEGSLDFLWQKTPRAATYRLTVLRGNVPVFDETFDWDAICDASTCALTPPQTFTPGSYRWIVTAANNHGETSSAEFTFFIWTKTPLRAQRLNTAEILSVASAIPGNPPAVQVHVTGSFNTACGTISRTEQAVTGFTVALTVYTSTPAGVMCGQSLKPFDVQFPVDTTALPAGEYTVTINGITAGTFTLD